MTTEPSYTLSNEPCIKESADPTDHAWETTILPPVKGSRCMCGRFVWPPPEPYSDYPDEDDDSCSYCGGDGWGIVGTDWDCEDGVNGPYNGEIEQCPNCHGSGKAKDMTFW